jgi:hypothetical protein
MDPEVLKNLSQGRSTDMSSEAILRRLDIASQLFDLVGALRDAPKVGNAGRVIPDPARENPAEARNSS